MSLRSTESLKDVVGFFPSAWLLLLEGVYELIFAIIFFKREIISRFVNTESVLYQYQLINDFAVLRYLKC